MSLSPVEDIGEEGPRRRLFRFLADGERSRLQGLPAECAEHMGKNLSHKVTGNAFATPMVVAVAMPLLQLVAESGAVQEKVKNMSPSEIFSLSHKQALERARSRFQLIRSGPSPKERLQVLHSD